MEKDDHFVKFSSWTIASVEKKHSKVCDYRFFQKSSNNTHVISVHEGKSHSNVTFSTEDGQGRVAWMLRLFMKERIH